MSEDVTKDFDVLTADADAMHEGYYRDKETLWADFCVKVRDEAVRAAEARAVSDEMGKRGWGLDSFDAIAEELERLSGLLRIESFRSLAGATTRVPAGLTEEVIAREWDAVIPDEGEFASGDFDWPFALMQNPVNRKCAIAFAHRIFALGASVAGEGEREAAGKGWDAAMGRAREALAAAPPFRTPTREHADGVWRPNAIAATRLDASRKSFLDREYPAPLPPAEAPECERCGGVGGPMSRAKGEPFRHTLSEDCIAHLKAALARAVAADRKGG